jgi:hypothetical protein
LSDSPACYLGITRGRVGTFYLPILPLYGFTKLLTNPFPIFYLLLNFKLPVLVLIWGLEQKKLESVFPHICVNGFGTCIGAFHLLEVPQHPLGIEGLCGHLQEMKCCSRILFCHCRTCQTRHLLSYMRQWFWDLYWSISPPRGASTPPPYRGVVWAPPRDEMLQ